MEYYEITEWQGHYSYRRILEGSTTVYCDRVVESGEMTEAQAIELAAKAAREEW